MVSTDPVDTDATRGSRVILESLKQHDALVEAGVTILRAPSDGRFGRQFTFVDLDGYAITIYDRDAPADGWDQIS